MATQRNTVSIRQKPTMVRVPPVKAALLTTVAETAAKYIQLDLKEGRVCTLSTVAERVLNDAAVTDIYNVLSITRIRSLVSTMARLRVFSSINAMLRPGVGFKYRITEVK